MKKFRTFILIVFVSALLCGCGNTGLAKQSSEGQPRTFYETLDLSTPESAVKVFSDAFKRDDFMTVYLVLSPQTQLIFRQRVAAYQYDYLFDIGQKDEVFADVTTFSQGMLEGEHYDDAWYLFDQIMLSAKKHSALLIDLSGKVTLKGTTASETEQGDAAMDVSAMVEGIEGEVVFRMVQAPSDRWRVYQVIVEGGDEERIPWAVPGLSD